VAPCVETAWREPGDAPARAVTLTDHTWDYFISISIDMKEKDDMKKSRGLECHM